MCFYFSPSLYFIYFGFKINSLNTDHVRNLKNWSKVPTNPLFLSCNFRQRLFSNSKLMSRDIAYTLTWKWKLFAQYWTKKTEIWNLTKLFPNCYYSKNKIIPWISEGQHKLSQHLQIYMQLIPNCKTVHSFCQGPRYVSFLSIYFDCFWRVLLWVVFSSDFWKSPIHFGKFII